MTTNTNHMGARGMLAEMRRKWDSSPNETHKRPPFRAHSFDDDGRYWVVGSSTVSVLHGAHGPREWAETIAAELNSIPTPQDKTA